jgi:hypothetical protein
MYLVAFDLATSPRFDQSVTERDFVERNTSYDGGYAAMVLVNRLVAAVCGFQRRRAAARRATSAYSSARPATFLRVCRRPLLRSSPGALPPRQGSNSFYWDA